MLVVADVQRAEATDSGACTCTCIIFTSSFWQHPAYLSFVKMLQVCVRACLKGLQQQFALEALSVVSVPNDRTERGIRNASAAVDYNRSCSTQSMQTMQLGSSDLQASVACIGTMVRTGSCCSSGMRTATAGS